MTQQTQHYLLIDDDRSNGEGSVEGREIDALLIFIPL